MKARGWVSIIGATAVFVACLALFRLWNWMAFAISGWTFAILWLSMTPIRRRKLPSAAPPPVDLPEGVARADHDAAVERLRTAAYALRELADRARGADEALFARLSAMIWRIRSHHEANPRHVLHTRTFIRHALDRMVEAARGYADLSRRTGGAEAERLDDIRGRIEGFVPVLERIDKACVENDLTALDIETEVLSQQLRR